MALFTSRLLALGFSWLALTSYAQWGGSPTVSLESTAISQTTSAPPLAALTPRQLDNVVALGQVWGFLKYFHSAVAAGQRDWDADLLRKLPAVLACRSVADRSQVLSTWITSLGTVPACGSCSTLPAQLVHLSADLEWAQDTKRFDVPLRQQLAFIAANRYQGIPYYVSTAPAGNPVFAHEEAYADQACPTQSLLLLLATKAHVHRFLSLLRRRMA